MCNQCELRVHRAPNVLRTHAARKDPTHTTRLRLKFEQDINARFRKLKGLIRKSLENNPGLTTNATAAAPGQFEFTRSADKVEAFMRWLNQAQDSLILERVAGTRVTAGSPIWADVYIDSAYQRGLAHSANNLRAAGVEVSERWIDSAFFRPVHADRLGLIYTRVYSDLRGITQAMDQQISRVLTQGIAEGRGMMSIARDINDRVDKIGRTRARVLARTEVIAAHAEATLNAYEEAGVHGVNVQAEWSTSGDDRVCEDCQAMEGRTFSMEEAHGMIPLHPNCRCAWLPVVMDPNNVRLN